MPDPYPGNLEAGPPRRPGKSRPPVYRYQEFPAWLKNEKGEEKVFQSAADVPRGAGWSLDGVPIHPDEKAGAPAKSQPKTSANVQTDDDDQLRRARDHNALLAADNKQFRADVQRLEEECAELRGQLGSQPAVGPSNREVELERHLQAVLDASDEASLHAAMNEAEEFMTGPDDEPEGGGDEDWLKLDLEGLRNRASQSMHVEPGWNLNTLRARYRAFLEGQADA